MKSNKSWISVVVVIYFLSSCAPSLDVTETSITVTASLTQTVVNGFTDVPKTVTPFPPYKPRVENQRLVDFEFCSNIGGTGSPEPNNLLSNKCVSLPEREDKVAELRYQTPSGWAAYWIKLDVTDFTLYDRLVFFAKAEPTEGSLRGFKIEFWGADHAQHTVYTDAKLETDWRKYEIPLVDFECVPNEKCFNWNDVEELVFTFETERSGTEGTVFLTDIYVERHETGMPTPEIIMPVTLLIANFDNGIQTNLLGGDMGVACPAEGCPSPNRLIAMFVFEDGSLRLEYAINEWAAFWIKLQKSDLSKYNKLRFDIRSDSSFTPSRQIKVEIKRGKELGVLYFDGITDVWQSTEVNLSDFRNPGWGEVLSGWTDMDELVFTFEASKSGGGGIIYLDNIEFVP